LKSIAASEILRPLGKPQWQVATQLDEEKSRAAPD
jgi:hypothetical protein